jgi:hypothetical protein
MIYHFDYLFSNLQNKPYHQLRERQMNQEIKLPSDFWKNVLELEPQSYNSRAPDILKSIEGVIGYDDDDMDYQPIMTEFDDKLAQLGHEVADGIDHKPQYVRYILYEPLFNDRENTSVCYYNKWYITAQNFGVTIMPFVKDDYYKYLTIYASCGSGLCHSRTEEEIYDKTKWALVQRGILEN